MPDTIPAVFSELCRLLRGNYGLTASRLNQSPPSSLPPSSSSRAGCPSPVTPPVRARRCEPAACRRHPALASRWRGACGPTPGVGISGQGGMGWADAVGGKGRLIFLSPARGTARCRGWVCADQWRRLGWRRTRPRKPAALRPRHHAALRRSGAAAGRCLTSGRSIPPAPSRGAAAAYSDVHAPATRQSRRAHSIPQRKPPAPGAPAR